MIPKKLITALLGILLCFAASFSAQAQNKYGTRSGSDGLDLSHARALPKLEPVATAPGSVFVEPAQEAIGVKERLPNGEFIVIIDGIEQRTITQEHAEQIKRHNEELDRCQRARAVIDQLVAKQDQEIVLLKKDRELADAQVALERERAGRIESMYESEYALRLKAEQLNNAHGRVGRFFENPLVQIGFKAVVPAVTMVRAFRN